MLRRLKSKYLSFFPAHKVFRYVRMDVIGILLMIKAQYAMAHPNSSLKYRDIQIFDFNKKEYDTQLGPHQLRASASSRRAGRCFWAFPESWAF